MTVGEIREQLSQFPSDMELLITDGFNCRCYRGDYEISEFEGCVDIGIGGTEEVE